MPAAAGVKLQKGGLGVSDIRATPEMNKMCHGKVLKCY